MIRCLGLIQKTEDSEVKKVDVLLVGGQEGMQRASPRIRMKVRRHYERNFGTASEAAGAKLEDCAYLRVMPNACVEVIVERLSDVAQERSL